MTDSKTNIIIDFDSTFASVEALEEIADIVLKGRADKPEILNEIKAITNLGVDGKITFNESLNRRLALLKIHRDDLSKLIRRLKRKVSTSFSRNKAFFKKYEGQIFIISNGFKDFIDPVVEKYGIDDEHVLANTFIYNADGWVDGFDEANLLAHSKGKSKTLKALNLPGESYVIGDAYTDYEMKEAGIAHKFFAFTENVLRENILEKADHITPSFDEFLYVNNMPSALSYPKNRIKVLLTGGILPVAQDAFHEEGYQVSTSNRVLTETGLARKIKQVSILGIPPHQMLTEAVLQKANRLIAVGVFGGLTHQIDLAACAKRGIVVFNAPYSSTRSLVELAIGEMIMLLRRIPTFSRQMRAGEWDATPQQSFEIRGKKLGIIGYGNSGTQLSVLAESLGMDVYYYDIFEKQAIGNATKCQSMKELLRKADVVSINIDGRSSSTGFFDQKAFKQMRKGAILINLTNGKAVDLMELHKNLKSGHLAGAAIDVFPQEPGADKADFVSELASMENVILTPHIGGKTVEAQENTAQFLPSQIIDYINTGKTFGSANFPSLQLPELKNAHRLIHIHENRPGLLASINSTLAKHHINIIGQYLKTNEQIGYVITDINKKYSNEVLKDLKEIEHTIKFRVLY
ncbi:MAG: phosphoglycerate dehydrogenase [Bacteroidota bacterium]